MLKSFNPFALIASIIAFTLSMRMAESGGGASMDDLLDSTLDDLADLPEFKNFPEGVHIARINFESKEVNKHPAVELKMVLVSTVEQADPAEAPAEPGTEGNVLYMLDNEFGQGKFKEIMKVISAHTGTSKIRETMEKSKDLECKVVIKHRQNKDKTATFMDVKNIEVC